MYMHVCISLVLTPTALTLVAYTKILDCSPETVFGRAVFIFEESGSPHYTLYAVVIPWVEQCITKSVCGKFMRQPARLYLQAWCR